MKNELLATAKEHGLTSNQVKAGIALGIMLVSTIASANTAIQVPDMSSVITFIGGLAAAISAIGLAILSIYALARSFSLVKKAF